MNMLFSISTKYLKLSNFVSRWQWLIIFFLENRYCFSFELWEINLLSLCQVEKSRQWNQLFTVNRGFFFVLIISAFSQFCHFDTFNIGFFLADLRDFFPNIWIITLAYFVVHLSKWYTIILKMLQKLINDCFCFYVSLQ